MDFNINLPSSVDNAIKNTSDGITKQVGNYLADSFYLRFGNKSYLAKKRRILEKYGLIELENLLKTIVKNIDPQKLIIPDFQTLHLALANSEFCMSSEVLRKMFANLIASACNSDTKDYIHPSFSEIIKQMSSFDATFLQYFVKERPKTIFTYNFYDKQSSPLLTRVAYVIDEYPTFNDAEKVSIAFSSLLRLGILNAPASGVGSFSVDGNFAKSDFYKECESSRKKYYPNSFSRMENLEVSITPFGESFIKTCLFD